MDSDGAMFRQIRGPVARKVLAVLMVPAVLVCAGLFCYAHDFGSPSAASGGGPPTTADARPHAPGASDGGTHGAEYASALFLVPVVILLLCSRGKPERRSFRLTWARRGGRRPVVPPYRGTHAVTRLQVFRL